MPLIRGRAQSNPVAPLLALLVLLTAAVPSAIAHAETRAELVARIGSSGAFARGPVAARVGQRVELRVELVDGRRRRPVPPGARVSFERIVPHMQHRDTPPPNDGIAQYSNSVLFGPAHGRWLGYDTIEYESEGVEDTDTSEGPAPLAVDRAPGPGGAGTIFYAAEVTLADGRTLRTADASSADHLGLSHDVLRVSFRASDDYLGWLSTYFLVPNVFGSTGAQADRYLGADCADVLVGAKRASGARNVRYTSVTGIASVASPVSDALVLDEEGVVRDALGAPVRLRWGDDIAPGDLFAIDYTQAGADLPRAWDHIGALVGDGGAEDGTLDGEDLLRHMTPRGLLDRPLVREAPIRFRVWRFRR